MGELKNEWKETAFVRFGDFIFKKKKVKIVALINLNNFSDGSSSSGLLLFLIFILNSYLLTI